MTTNVPSSTGEPRRPVPVPNDLTREFWESAARGVLSIQRCQCGRWFHPPVPVCAECQSSTLHFEPVSGAGTVYSLTISTEPLVPGFESVTPLLVALVELDEQEGLVLASNLLDVDPSDVRIGDRVAVAFEPLAPGLALPQFQPAEGARG